MRVTCCKDDSKIDVFFLDIEMPEESGLELRKKAAEVPVCIFITAHPEHAVESFELDTLDFIVKPLKLDRFSQTIKRIEEFMEIKHKALLFESSIGGDTIYIKEGHEQTKVKLHDILYLEALKDYTLIVTSQKRHCVLSSIGNLLKEDHFQSFIRTHRSFAVQKQYIKKILTNDVLLNNDVLIPIGRSHKESLKMLL
ncbi:MAG: response regulator transcription factor [Flavobacterium sp.]|nr:response regulator transcription factor [Flavobacterium sp.]